LISHNDLHGLARLWGHHYKQHFCCETQLSYLTFWIDQSKEQLPRPWSILLSGFVNLVFIRETSFRPVSRKDEMRHVQLPIRERLQVHCSHWWLVLKLRS
jgi:hypothetical protein